MRRRKNTRSSSRGFSRFCLALALATVPVTAVLSSEELLGVTDYLQGLRYRNETENHEMQHCSMAGGQEIFIDGSGFDESAPKNLVLFDSTQQTLRLPGIKLEIDDEIQSAPSFGRLAYTTPSLSELYRLPMAAFANHFTANNGDEKIRFDIIVQNGADNKLIPCPQNKKSLCRFDYSMRYTPLLHDISPSNVYLDQKLTFYINVQAAHDSGVIHPEADPVDFIKFSGTRTDFEELFDSSKRLNSYRVDYLESRSGDQDPGNSVPEVRFRVGNAHLRESAKHCNFAGTDCWYIKTHPKIDSVSASSGFMTGGQELTVKGWGLRGKTAADVTVTVDGIVCKVTAFQMESIKCTTGASATASLNNVSQPGSPGLTQTRKDKSPYWDLRTDATVPVAATRLLTAFENYRNEADNFGMTNSGWFKAPESGRYRFYVSCDDACKLFLDSTNQFSRSAPKEPVLAEIAQRYWNSEWRNYLLPTEPDQTHKPVSEWVSLTKGEFYKIEGYAMEWGGQDHFSVAVEFEKADALKHHHARKEIQMLEVSTDNIPEQFTITVVKPSGTGRYRVQFLNPLYDYRVAGSIQWWKSDYLKDNASADTLTAAIQGFWSSIWGSSISVTKKNFDADNGEITTTTGVTVEKSVYTVSVNKRLSQPSFNMNAVLPEGLTSTVSASMQTQQSSLPLKGKFKVVCTDANGKDWETQEMAFNTWTEGIDFDMQLRIPMLQFKTKIHNSFTYPYRENGIKFAIVFQDLHEAAPKCRLQSGVDTPLTGANPKFSATTIWEYNKNLLWEPVPLEFLYTDAKKPQVRVTVNGVDGVCPNLNCDYTYVSPVGEITAQSLSGKDITVQGTSLPTLNVSVAVANSKCITVTATATQITCTLDIAPAAGSWNVKVTDVNGLIPIASGVAKISVALTVSSVSPNNNLNQLGGDELVFTGTGFDTIKDNTQVVFSDQTKCDVTATTPTQLKCIVAGFSKTTINTSANAYTATITVNAVVDSTQKLSLKSTVQTGVSVSPVSVSPVLSSELIVTLQSTYPYALAVADFNAKLVLKSNPAVTRPLYVMSVDNTAKTVKIKFPGAESGTYYVQLQSTQIGRIDQTPLELEVIGKVTAYAPASGSYLGGTLMTIDGVNFSDKSILDNPVKVGNTYCLVESTTKTQIKCRVQETGASATSSADVIVFLRTQEEAKNTLAKFTYANPLETITGLTNAFDATKNAHVFTLTGTGFTNADLTSVSLFLDGLKQETLTVSSTQATFKVINANDASIASLRVYFNDGLPTGYQTFMVGTMTPTLVSISPASGSSGGTLITVRGTGFGLLTKGVQLVTESGAEICQTVTLTKYGEFTCLTKAMEIPTTSTLRLKTAAGFYGCANTLNAADCKYTQTNAASPKITAVSITNPTTLEVTGSGFFTSAYTAVVVISNVESSTAVINSATSVTATFTNGIPVGASAMVPTLKFVPSTGNALMVAYVTGVSLTNALSVTASSSAVSCSFQGGCAYSVTANGLTSLLKSDPTSRIDVCGKTCTLIEADSNASTAVCTLPLAQTAYAASTYAVVNQEILTKGEWSGTATAAELAKLIDNKNMIDMQDTTTGGCRFQIKYLANHVAVLDEVKIFINNLIDKTPFQGNLTFQGSNDGVTFTDLWTLDAGVHEGWNAKIFTDPKPAYNIYRFNGKTTGSCRVGEVKIYGIESINDNSPTFSCTPKVVLQGQTSSASLNPVTYSAAKTAVLTSMSTRFGSVLGNEVVEFIGTGFSASAATTVLIDRKPCTVSATTTTKITCTTAPKPTIVAEDPSLLITIAGQGYVATKGLVFRYVSRWSSPQTWNYDLSPQTDEAVNIPKGLHLLVDIDATPKLSFVNVEGSLLFEPHANPNHQRTFDADYILVKGGYMEVGTEEYRYTSKLTITMWGSKYTPNLPIFGNKVIGVHYGTLSMHGKLRSVTWTDLKVTAEAGATSITLNDMKTGVVLDWQPGEEIVIASTDFEGRHAEQRTIATVTNASTNPVITFTEALLYKHYAGVQTFGSDTIEMRAEVGLLTRNVKYQGDASSPLAQYGAVIICHSPADESTVARIDSIELYNVGQAFILGSYPIHFHMIGTVHTSYVRNNAIHHTFNRAVTIHGVHYLRVQNNVAYHTMGHTIFIEDAAETNNLIENNLVVDVRRSWSLLNTDQTPANFWITNPNNIFRGNHAAGSDRYSYWFDLQTSAIGPSFDTNICPENTKLGEFRDNVAHSNGRYGLRIFHNLIPRTYPCKPMVYSGDPLNPYPDNPPITAQFHNLVSYKNKRNGAIAERVGSVQFHNFKTADNLLAGMEFSLSEDIIDGHAKIVGGLVVGRSANTETLLDEAEPHGIITPRTENFSVEGTKFFNFNWNKAACIGTCSHCFHPASTDSGARTVRFSNLVIDTASVTRRVRFQEPFRAILLDETGSFTGLGPKTWVVPYYKHLEQPECQVDLVKFDGIICNSSVQVRRIAFSGATPSSFSGMELKIAKFDPTDVAKMKEAGTLEAYLNSESNYSVVPFRPKLKPSKGWAMPYVTGHSYRIHWRRGLDFDTMFFELSERWEATDKTINFQTNFTETREAVNFTYGVNNSLILNETLINKATDLLETGDNWVRNDTATRLIDFAVNGKNKDKFAMTITGFRCLASCALSTIVTVPLETGTRLWSDVNNWDGKQLPQEGQDVVIPSGWNMLLDIEETPVLKSLEINGRLSFIQNGKNIHLRSKQIFVRAGELFIGNSTHPFQANALITLFGAQKEETLVITQAVSAGNKILATTGSVKFFGKPRSQMTRLTSTAFQGATEIYVEPGLDWVSGDEIYLAPTAIQFDHSDYRKIVEYNKVSGYIRLDKPLRHYHWGDFQSTADEYNGVDMRGEVVLLTRNVKIQGEDRDGWGGQVLVTDFFEIDGTWRTGSLIFDNVQVYNCSQADTYKAAIRFESAMGAYSRVSNSTVHNSMAWSVSVFRSNNVVLTDSYFIGSVSIGVHIDFVKNFTMTRTMTADVMIRVFKGFNMVDKEACVAICTYMVDQGSPCFDMTITNNIAAGCKFAGFLAPGYDCDTASTKFKDNVSHSNLGVGAAIFPDYLTGSNHFKCYEMSHFKAYKTTLPCVAAHYATLEMRAHDLTCIDSNRGINLQTGNESEKVVIKFYDSFIFGETRADDCPTLASCDCEEKFGLMLFGNNKGAKDFHILMPSARPIYKIKSSGAWGGEVYVENVTFAKFATKGMTKCQNKIHVFARNPYSSDKIPPHYFKNCKFQDVDDASMAFFDDPDEGWANLDDCGAFPCTAPNNILMSFTGTRYAGQMPIRTDQIFQMIPDDPKLGGRTGSAVQNCEFRKEWQGYHCRNRQLAYLIFESLDADRLDRSIQPIFILNETSGFNNTLNSMMDHVWDGFYTGQVHESRFPTLITTDRDYRIEITGTPPERMRFQLYAEIGGVKLQIYYPVAGSIKVTANGQPKDYTPWNAELGAPGPLSKTYCGENRFVPVDNYLEFYITKACEIKIEPRNVVMSKIRMEWTMEEFYKDGGVTRFVDRMAASLGIPSYRIKTVAVYEGSVIIDFAIEADDKETPEQAAKSLEKLQKKLVAKIEAGTLKLGAPIIGLQNADGVVLTGDPIPERGEAKIVNPDSSAIIKNGPNLWDDLVKAQQAAAAAAKKAIEEAAAQKQKKNEEAQLEFKSSIDSLPDDKAPPKTTPEQTVITVKVTTQSEAQEETSTKDDDSQKYIIVIPVIVVGVLLLAVAGILIKICSKRSQKHPNVIREQVNNTDVNNSVGNQDVQYVMDSEAKVNIFARSTLYTPSDGSRSLRKKNKSDQDEVVDHATNSRTSANQSVTSETQKRINVSANALRSALEDDKDVL